MDCTKCRHYVPTRDLYQSLPTILLGLRTSIHEDLKATSAELVFGENLHLPGDFLHDLKLASPSSFVQQLRNTFADLRPVLPAHHTKQKSFIFNNLETFQVFVLLIPFLSIKSLYEGPYPPFKLCKSILHRLKDF
ncbi:hypothetical protein TNIN_306471 [Trichonephila inaurata madagascariensis]|uniref:Uncharacterized protein n=1 Tax=Trichonephila inaurata madagascariensis TaxID=2747483 RepID=A0A8X6INR6_9ARAC|nr:hypothetical protein TNIN_306471 [Trichonephila inaurata madagascariensis]